MGTTAGRRWAPLLIAAAVALTGGCTSPTEADAPPTALSRITQRGAIRVCSTGDYRPFTYRDAQGNWSGLDVEMAATWPGASGPGSIWSHDVDYAGPPAHDPVTGCADVQVLDRFSEVCARRR